MFDCHKNCWVLCMDNGYLNIDAWKKGQSRKVSVNGNAELGSTLSHYRNKSRVHQKWMLLLETKEKLETTLLRAEKHIFLVSHKRWKGINISVLEFMFQEENKLMGRKGCKSKRAAGDWWLLLVRHHQPCSAPNNWMKTRDGLVHLRDEEKWRGRPKKKLSEATE